MGSLSIWWTMWITQGGINTAIPPRRHKMELSDFLKLPLLCDGIGSQIRLRRRWEQYTGKGEHLFFMKFS
ncbi:hypothetical protein VTK73DRAFT_733 [Phialemonium thermophilum]|uniref:Uncharacterized protein n=1 Tax=Phialemonium thermophilum TaxID=223376 RepID=A0ABR3XCZ3_9PEZI